MSDPIYFAPLNTPLVNPDTGIVTRQWYLLFQSIFKRIGGSLGNGTDDLQQFPGAESIDVSVPALSVRDELSQLPGLQPPQPSFEDVIAELQALRDQNTEIVKRLDEISQGTQL